MSSKLSQQKASDLRDRFITIRSRRDFIAGQLTSIESRLASKQEVLLVRLKSFEVLRQLVDTFYDRSIKRLERIVSLGLQEVFPDRLLRIKADVGDRRGKTIVDIVTVDDEYGVEGKASRSFGGAVVQVQSFLMLATFIILLKLKPICFLDEQFSNVSSQYQGQVGKMISSLCKQMNLSVCLITHNEEILEHADRVYKAKMEDGQLKLECFKND